MMKYLQLALLILTASVAQGADRPPNVLIVLADDLGIECLNMYGGSSYDTPNLDRLAEQGMRFTHCFAHPYCSPSRASLLTGRYPFRHGLPIVIWDAQRHANDYLHTDQPSFARQLKQAGYATAIAGKWQLSFLHQRNTINDFGFDTYQCWQIHTPGGERTTRYHQPHFNRDGRIIAEQIKDRYGPDVNVEFLAEFITTNAEAGKPFLAYYTCMLPHFPWVPTPDSADQGYRPPDSKHKGDPAYFGDMVRYMDKLVGQLMQTLDDAGVAENTVVIFLADNGTDQGLQHPFMGDHVVLGGKGSLTDRGTRVPLLVRWPGRVEPGTTCDDLIDFADLLPTLCEIAGAPLPDQPIHGRSFLPQLRGEAGNPRAWVHVQMDKRRHLRTREYILTNENQLRPIVDLWADPAEAIRNDTPEQAAARRQLQAVLDELALP